MRYSVLSHFSITVSDDAKLVMFFRYPNKISDIFKNFFNLIKTSERLVPFDSANMRRERMTKLIKSFKGKYIRLNTLDYNKILTSSYNLAGI